MYSIDTQIQALLLRMNDEPTDAVLISLLKLVFRSGKRLMSGRRLLTHPFQILGVTDCTPSPFAYLFGMSPPKGIMYYMTDDEYPSNYWTLRELTDRLWARSANLTIE